MNTIMRLIYRDTIIQYSRDKTGLIKNKATPLLKHSKRIDLSLSLGKSKLGICYTQFSI